MSSCSKVIVPTHTVTVTVTDRQTDRQTHTADRLHYLRNRAKMKCATLLTEV